MDGTLRWQPTIVAALSGLLVLNLAMYGALLAQVMPHPPGHLGPLIAMIMAVTVVALMLALFNGRGAFTLALAAAALNLLSFGPHKLLTMAGDVIAPAVYAGTGCSAAIVTAIAVHAWRRFRVSRRETLETAHESSGH